MLVAGNSIYGHSELITCRIVPHEDDAWLFCHNRVVLYMCVLTRPNELFYRRDKQPCWEVCYCIWWWGASRKLNVSGHTSYKSFELFCDKESKFWGHVPQFPLPLCMHTSAIEKPVNAACNTEQSHFLCIYLNLTHESCWKIFGITILKVAPHTAIVSSW
jgi:hypothetical protein